MAQPSPEAHGPDTDRSWLRPDADRALGLLDGQAERSGPDRLLVTAADPAAVNARLVAAGLRVTEIAAERRSLEDVVLSVTSSGSDRFDGAVPGGPVPEDPVPGDSVPDGAAGAGEGETP